MADSPAPPSQTPAEASKHMDTAPQSRRRQRTPTIMQMESTESGAVALAILLGSHGLFVELDALRKACGVGRDGATLKNVAKAAATYGMEVAVHDDVNVAGLLTLPTPLIALFEGGQYVVVEGYTPDKVYVNDPSSGPKTFARRDFKSAFDDAAITMAPGPGFKKGGQAPSTLGAMTARLRGNGRSLAFVLIASLALIFPLLLTPLFTQVFIDQFLSGGVTDTLSLLLIGMLITAFLRGALTWMQSHYLLRLQTRLSITMSANFFWHVLRLPMDFFSQRYRGEIGSRLGLNDLVAVALSQELAMAVINVLLAVFYLAMMLFYDITLTLVVLSFGLLNILILRLITRLIGDSNKRVLQQNGKLTGVSMNGVQAIDTLKATGTESDFFARWTGLQAKVYNAQQNLQVPLQILNAVPMFLTALSTAAVLVIGGWRIMDGALTIGMLVAFQSLSVSFLSPMGDLLDLGTTYQGATSAVLRLDDMLETPADPLLPSAGLHLPGGAAGKGRAALDADGSAAGAPVGPGAPAKLNGRLELRNITFGYDPVSPPLIENFNLVVEPGSRVALVGGTGSGKSTVANLVVGLNAPWSGDVFFDDMPRAAVPHGIMTNSMAKVDQNLFIFEGTFQDNLTLWDSLVPQAHVLQAAHDACIHDAIAQRPGAYQSIVAEGGKNLSGGQAQRLEIARALVLNPSILILDEATSALDPPTEAAIDANLRRRGCTCLIVAHRLSTIRDCDEIIVLENGKVVQRGTHDEMYLVDGPYRRLIQAQQTADEAAGAGKSGGSDAGRAAVQPGNGKPVSVAPVQGTNA